MISLQELIRKEPDLKQKQKPQGRKLKMHLSCQQRTNQPGLVWGSKELERKQTVIQLQEGRDAKEGENEVQVLLLGAKKLSGLIF